jgi:hypothetical protein
MIISVTSGLFNSFFHYYIYSSWNMRLNKHQIQTGTGNNVRSNWMLCRNKETISEHHVSHRTVNLNSDVSILSFAACNHFKFLHTCKIGKKNRARKVGNIAVKLFGKAFFKLISIIEMYIDYFSWRDGVCRIVWGFLGNRRRSAWFLSIYKSKLSECYSV